MQAIDISMSKLQSVVETRANLEALVAGRHSRHYSSTASGERAGEDRSQKAAEISFALKRPVQ